MLASVNISTANSDVAIYTVPTGKRAVFSLSLCNRSASAVSVNVALVASGGSPAADGSNCIEFSLSIPSYQAYERAGLVLNEGQILFVRSTALNAISAVVYGIVE